DECDDEVMTRSDDDSNDECDDECDDEGNNITIGQAILKTN
ncbi:7133_t:CDS:1, partial [Cetraspora pellucida]